MTIIHCDQIKNKRIEEIALNWLNIAGLRGWHEKRILFTKLWSIAVGSPQDLERMEETIRQLKKLDGSKIEVQEVLIWITRVENLMRKKSGHSHG